MHNFWIDGLKMSLNIMESRRNWKLKAMERGLQVRELRRQQGIKDSKIADLLEDVVTMEGEIKKLKTMVDNLDALRQVPERHQVVVICVQLFLFARISFRSIPRVLSTMSWAGRVPSFSSVINWVCRLGLYKMQNTESLSGPWVAIVDMSIDIAFKKVLVVLRIPLNVFCSRKTSLTLQDVDCIGLEVNREWNGATVNQALQRILGNGKDLKVIIKDRGTDLNKGVNLWRDEHASEHVFVVSDLGHEVANSLKADFVGRIKFSEVTETIKSSACKFFQSGYSFLAPPKIRTKGRFMGISRIANWFEKIRGLMGGPGRAKYGSDANELRKLIGGLASIHYPLDKIIEFSKKTAEVMKILKNRGLNQETFRESKKIIDSLPPRSDTRKRMNQWLKTHLAIQSQLSISQTPLPVSSDVIESLFGTFKAFIARNSKAEFNHLVLAIPALCGTTTAEQIIQSRKTVSHKAFQDWKKNNIGTTAIMRRREFLNGKNGPDSGHFPGNLSPS